LWHLIVSNFNPFIEILNDPYTLHNYIRTYINQTHTNYIHRIYQKTTLKPIHNNIYNITQIHHIITHETSNLVILDTHKKNLLLMLESQISVMFSICENFSQKNFKITNELAALTDVYFSQSQQIEEN
jgi:hypothetical protein